MRAIVFLEAMTFATFFIASIAFAQSCDCGETYCMNTPQYQTALKKKKAAAIAKGYPARLVSLYDKLDACDACVTGSPDGFSLLVVRNDNSRAVDAWESANEKNDAAAVAAGTLKSCFVLLQRRACVGCKQAPYDKRADYDALMDLNKSLSVPCSK